MYKYMYSTGHRTYISIIMVFDVYGDRIKSMYAWRSYELYIQVAYACTCRW